MKISKGINIRPKDGHYYVFMNYKTQRFAFQYDTEDQAITVAKAFMEAKNNGTLERQLAGMKKPDTAAAKKASITLAEYHKRFEKVYLTTAVRQGTREIYEGAFEQHILPQLGAMPLAEITREQIRDFVAHMVAKRFIRRKKVKTYPDPTKMRKPIITWKEIETAYSKSTIRIILSSLCTVFAHAVEENVIAVNPAMKLGKLFKLSTKDVHEEIQPLTAEEVSAFFSAVLDRAWSRDYYPVFLCAIHTGLRSGELIGLQWGDVDFRSKFLIVRRQFTRGRVELTKTGKTRRVDISDSLLRELQALRTKRQKDFLKDGKNEIPEWVFCNKEGNPLDHYNLKRRHFEKCLSAAKLRRIRFHDLRHTYASLLIQNGESLAYIKDQLGHSSIKMTVDVYGHLVPGANRAAVNRLPTIGVPKADVASR